MKNNVGTEADLKSGGHCTVPERRMSHRKWWQTKQQLSWLPDLALLGCCLLSLHFLCDILSGRPVHYIPLHNNARCALQRILCSPTGYVTDFPRLVMSVVASQELGECGGIFEDVSSPNSARDTHCACMYGGTHIYVYTGPESDLYAWKMTPRVLTSKSDHTRSGLHEKYHIRFLDTYRLYNIYSKLWNLL